MTVEQFYDRPRGEFRRELWAGEPIQMQPQGFEHGVVVANLIGLLWQHVKQNKLGVLCGVGMDFQVSTDPDTVLSPDLGFITRERISHAKRPRRCWLGAPDLAIEVTAPDESLMATNNRAEGWLRFGARAVWIVNPKRKTVIVHHSLSDKLTLKEDDILEVRNILPGFRCKVSEIFD